MTIGCRYRNILCKSSSFLDAIGVYECDEDVTFALLSSPWVIKVDLKPVLKAWNNGEVYQFFDDMGFIFPSWYHKGGSSCSLRGGQHKEKSFACYAP